MQLVLRQHIRRPWRARLWPTTARHGRFVISQTITPKAFATGENALNSGLSPAGRPFFRLCTPSTSEEAGVRYSISARLGWCGRHAHRRPWSLELMYTCEMMAGLLLRQDSAWPRQALLIGLGASSLVKFIYRHLPPVPHDRGRDQSPDQSGWPASISNCPRSGLA